MYTAPLNLESVNKIDLHRPSFKLDLSFRDTILSSEGAETLHESSNRQFKNTWAFAIDRSNFNSRRQQLADLRDCVISSCSKDAKRLGVYAGMRYSDAIALIPDMRILVIGGVNV